DIPRGLRGRSLHHELFWARIGTVGIAAAAAWFSLVSGDVVALLGTFGWGIFAAALVPVVAIGFNWKRATPLAANLAVLAAIVINFGIKLFDIPIPHAIDGGAVALLVSLTLFFGVSLLSAPPRLDADIEALMDM
ncbi:MAG: hypothetical protein AB7K24_30270, partial [Gemmataceae bacterium]